MGCLLACPPGRCGKPRLFQTSSMISFSSLPQTSVTVQLVCPHRLLPKLDRNGTSPMQNPSSNVYSIFRHNAAPNPCQNRNEQQTNTTPTNRANIRTINIKMLLWSIIWLWDLHDISFFEVLFYTACSTLKHCSEGQLRPSAMNEGPPPAVSKCDTYRKEANSVGLQCWTFMQEVPDVWVFLLVNLAYQFAYR